MGWKMGEDEHQVKTNQMKEEIKVIELFAGVGGFRLGLEGWKGKSASSGYAKRHDSPYRIVWSNQWEPSTKMQHASMVYEYRFGAAGHSNQDISSVPVSEIPDHDMLVGGFPCQDYSVATTLKNSKGLIGKKGVLWWSIHRILEEKKKKPGYLLLENVDRLLISPSKQRGRDFAIILKSLETLGYAVEWRVINAADYGMPQRRRRVFIAAYHKTTTIYRRVMECGTKDWILHDGTLAEAFPHTDNGSMFPDEFHLKGDIVSISSSFNNRTSPVTFENSGMMVKGIVTTIKTSCCYEGPMTTLGDIIEDNITGESFRIDEEYLERWIYLKGPKKETRVNAEGFEYHYSEGGMLFPDALDRPSRTIITGEGGSSPSRFKHVIKTRKGYRRLTPVELERLNMFPDKHTEMAGISDAKRAFFMGNALVVGVIEKIAVSLKQKIRDEFAVQA
jgi:DNA (cytosine-5)-methyltransferase 1